MFFSSVDALIPVSTIIEFYLNVMQMKRVNIFCDISISTNCEIDNEEWKMNFFQGIPSPAGGCLILFPIMYDLSIFSNFLKITNLSPYLVVIASILLISKVPTFSFKKIVVQRQTT